MALRKTSKNKGRETAGVPIEISTSQILSMWLKYYHKGNLFS